MPGPNISVQGTPNPNAAKFTVDRTLVEGGASVSYFDPDTAKSDPLASRLFELPGVDSLLIAEDFVTVTKASAADWNELVPKIESILKEVLS
jgi:hypothetical protein